MMINTNYSAILAQAKIDGATQVNFDQRDYSVKAITAEKDTVTISDAALAKMNGIILEESALEESAPTYVKPISARALIATANQEQTIESAANQNVQQSSNDRFGEIMQNILDKRLGVDREKLEEIDAMMAAIAGDENLSPEQKQKALEELSKMKEKLFEESMEMKKQAKHTFDTNDTI